MNPDSLAVASKQGVIALGVLAAIGLAGYALTYLVVMPQVSPGGFVPTTAQAGAGTISAFGAVLAAFILLYAFAFIPVSVMFTIKEYSRNPYALVFACCIFVISALIEIWNNLPVVAAYAFPVRLAGAPPETLLYLRQIEAIRYLAFDVAGFSLAYVSIAVYAIVYWRSRRRLSYTIVASIVLFIVNVPFLWFAPNAAVTLMALSVLAFAPVPIALARMAID
jgi:hypothetical protein